MYNVYVHSNTLIEHSTKFNEVAISPQRVDYIITFIALCPFNLLKSISAIKENFIAC